MIFTALFYKVSIFCFKTVLQEPHTVAKVRLDKPYKILKVSRGKNLLAYLMYPIARTTLDVT